MHSNQMIYILFLIVVMLLGSSAEDQRPDWCKDLAKSSQTCNPPEPGHPDCPHTWVEHCNLWQKMSDATKAAHAAQNLPIEFWILDFEHTKSAEKKVMLYQRIVDTYDECIVQREYANDVCREMRGTVTQGHEKSVQWYRDKKNAFLSGHVD
ncbi:hypothetical protein P171DRAFT_444194 [Karstenula rhodostoma CBS 690.94]|uniref:Uncharacterized protein n=1 Tax=Karstenula rhodostoma CBS 690.94 TaxID=1392251 RepID=A0A9P4UBB1_9PLEO|nr:hypothetical protein P171DRAFT_444194 [Karstenula rhodostoma CBS 690.94]